MSRRLLDVTADTDFDYLPARAEGVDWTDEGIAVLDVEAEGGLLELAVERDPVDLDRLEGHVDRVELTPDQARTLAATLRDRAAELDAEERDDAGRDGEVA